VSRPTARGPRISAALRQPQIARGENTALGRQHYSRFVGLRYPVQLRSRTPGQRIMRSSRDRGSGRSFGCRRGNLASSPRTKHYALIGHGNSHLGAPLTGGRVERRLAAVLAADVAGYSRLMGADEEGTLARLRGPDRFSLTRP